MIKLPNTLAFRLTLWYVSAFVSLIAAAFVALYLSINTIFDNHFNEDLKEDISEFEQLYRAEGLTKVEGEILREAAPKNANRVFLRLLNTQGQVVFSSDMTAWKEATIDRKAILLLSNYSNPVIQTIKFDSQEYPTKIIYGLITADTILQIGESTEEKAEIMELLFIGFFVVFIIAIPFASFIGWLMARQASSGIEQVSHTATGIQSGQLDKRVSVNSKDKEIQILASAFNAMLDRVHALITELREMTDNIAHDLRSPLGRIRAISELSLSNNKSKADYQQAAADTIEECDRLLRMINATLDVAEAESGISDAVSEEIDISSLTRDACELFEPVAEEKQIDLFCTVGSGCRTYGNMQYLQRMLANLIDNALKYTPSQGRINVDLTCTTQRIAITVSDNGEGISQQEQERIFDRFYRCEKSRTQQGCGMGLSFSQAVARAHGGEITVQSNPVCGTTFTISLPVIHKSH